MCGLVAVFAYGVDAPDIDREELIRIRDYMTLRGPDDAGYWTSADAKVGLGHRRLAIIDLSRGGHQPMASVDDRAHIVFNGEIYNFKELRRELSSKGHIFKTNSDTEVLLAAWLEWGEDMCPKLRGMYAFAIFDAQKRGLFLARDPFGIKPLYYADDGKTLRVASQVKALLAGGRVDKRPLPAGHVGFYLWGHVPAPFTLYQGIRSLPAGTSLWVGEKSDAAHRRFHEFFNISDELNKAEQTTASFSPGEIREQVRAALIDTVRQHLISDVPVGVFLSAGLDSTTMLALAKDAGLSDLRTVTLGFKEFANTQNDETPLAIETAEYYGAQHQTQWVQKENFAANMTSLLASMDQPSIDGVNSYFVCKAASQAGLKVAISGLGGDELFGGYAGFQQIPRMAALLAPFQATPLLGRGFRYLSAPVLKHFTSPKYAGLLEYGGTYGGAYLLRRGLYMPWELPNILDPDFVRQGWQDLQTLKCLKQSTAGVRNPHLRVTALDTAWYLQNQLLRDSDWASMAHSIELRVPLVDVELFRSVTRLIGGGHRLTKRDMASAPSVPLPASVLNRAKSGFLVPVREWMAASETNKSKPARGLRSWATSIMESYR